MTNTYYPTFKSGKPALVKQDTGTFPKDKKGVTFTLEKSEVHEIPAKPKRTPKVHWIIY